MTQENSSIQQRVALHIAKLANEPGALLPLLHAVQNDVGYIPEESIEPMAKALNLSRAEVYGVIKYYHHFRTEPVKGKLIQICRAEACKSVGADKLWEHAESTYGADHTVKEAYCLGLCANAPSAMVDDTLLAQVGSTKLDKFMGDHK